jgi:hypothetical protein
MMDQMGVLPGSITHGQKTVYGFLGEILIAELIGARHENTYNYDLIKGRWRIDVKTKCCTSRPRDHYECSIAAFNTRQQCHYYVFVRILANYSRAWCLGAIRKPEYFRLAHYCRKGMADVNGWLFKADCYNLPIKLLHPLRGEADTL